MQAKVSFKSDLFTNSFSHAQIIAIINSKHSNQCKACDKLLKDPFSLIQSQCVSID